MSDENVTQQIVEPVPADPGTAPVEPTPAVDPASAPGTPVEGEPQTPAEPGTEPDATPPQEPEQSKAVKDLITQRRKRQEADERAAYWQGVAENAQPKQPQAPVPTGSPVVENYDTFEEYQEAVIDYRVDKRLEKTTMKQREADMQQQYQDRLQAKPELAEKIHSAQVPRSVLDAMSKNNTIKAIQSSEFGPEIGAAIADSPEMATKLSQMDNIQATKFIGKLEARFEMPDKTPTKKISQAPAPITPVATGSGSVDKPLSEMTMEDFARARNAEEFKKRHG